MIRSKNHKKAILDKVFMYNSKPVIAVKCSIKERYDYCTNGVCALSAYNGYICNICKLDGVDGCSIIDNKTAIYFKYLKRL